MNCLDCNQEIEILREMLGDERCAQCAAACRQDESDRFEALQRRDGDE